MIATPATLEIEKEVILAEVAAMIDGDLRTVGNATIIVAAATIAAAIAALAIIEVLIEIGNVSRPRPTRSRRTGARKSPLVRTSVTNRTTKRQQLESWRRAESAVQP